MARRMRASAAAVLSLVIGAAHAAEVASVPGPARVIGLLELPSVLGHDGDPAVNPPPPVPRRAIPVFVDADGERRKLRELGKASDFQREEHTYEGESVVVYEREGAWYRVGLGEDGKRTAWVRGADAGTFRPIGTLLVESAAYLDADWDGRLWSTPDAGGSARVSQKKKRGAREAYAADVVETREVDGALWLHVRLYANDPCESGDTTTDEEGWVPAYGKGGALTAWFWSRGC